MDIILRLSLASNLRGKPCVIVVQPDTMGTYRLKKRIFFAPVLCQEIRSAKSSKMGFMWDKRAALGKTVAWMLLYKVSL